MEKENFKMEEFNKEVLLGNATWWQMNLPSGDVVFGEVKASILGYSDEMFKNYKDFVNLVHPEDSEKAMQAMRDHLSGKAKLYETTYRIKTKEGSYVKFYDCGQITRKDGDNLTITGFVMKVMDDTHIFEEMEEFKNMIIDGKPSIIELVSNIR